MAGRIYLTSHMTKDVLRESFQPSGAIDPALTPRQLEVLRLIAQGRRMKEIAAELHLSVRTVEDHKAQLLRALEASSTADLVRFAVKRGLVAD